MGLFWEFQVSSLDNTAKLIVITRNTIHCIIDIKGAYFTMSLIDLDCPCNGKNMNYFTAPWTLLTLYNHEGTHGYEIKKFIEGYMTDQKISLNITGLYRHLKTLEQRGLLTSEWDTPENGPAKRKYYLTEAGEECLWRWMRTLNTQLSLIQTFLKQAKAIRPPAVLTSFQPIMEEDQ